MSYAADTDRHEKRPYESTSGAISGSAGHGTDNPSLSAAVPWRRELHYWLAFGCCLVLLCLPILAVKYPPLVDYPSHIARAFVLYQYTSVPQFQEWWVRSLIPIPNVAVDAFLYLGLHFLNPYDAGRAFLLLTIVLFAASVHLLCRVADGRNAWRALPCMFFVYSSMLLYGFINYVFGLALAQLACAAWLSARRSWTVPRLVGVSALVLLSYFAHLAAYAIVGMFCVSVLGYQSVQNRPSARQAIADLLPLVPPLIVFVAFMQRGGRVGTIGWSMAGKMVGLFPLVLTYDRWLDVLVVGVVVATGIILFRRRKDVQLNWLFGVPAMLLLFVFAVAPWEAMTGTAVDQRFVPTALLFLCVALRTTLPTRVQYGLFGLIMLASVVRLGDIWWRWQDLDKETRVAIEMVRRLPTAARVYPVYIPAEGASAKRDRGISRLEDYAVIERHAYVPTMIAIRGQQPIYYRAPYAFEGLDRFVGDPAPPLQDYDFVWLRGHSPAAEQSLRQCCQSIETMGNFQLWRVRHPLRS